YTPATSRRRYRSPRRNPPPADHCETSPLLPQQPSVAPRVTHTDTKQQTPPVSGLPAPQHKPNRPAQVRDRLWRRPPGRRHHLTRAEGEVVVAKAPAVIGV